MNNVILSGKYPEFSKRLRELGYNTIPSENIELFIPYERDHADMQCLIIEDTAFVLSRCHSLIKALSGYYTVVSCAEDIKGKYPANVALNAAVVGRNIIARQDSLDEKIRAFCFEKGYDIINVNQGYANCSCAVVSDNAVITADKGIYNSLKETNLETLLIREGRVTLEGADHGFIGGASGLETSGGKHKLYFSGNIFYHPDADMIIEFCKKHDTEVISLTDSKLTDIGGMIFC